MDLLPHRHLATLRLEVDYAGILGIGAVREGLRGVANIMSGRFEGERLQGRVVGGHDWFVRRADGTLAIDVRLTLETDDGAAALLFYQGRMIGSPETMASFRRGALLVPADYSLSVVARWECGDPRYAWLNDLICVGIGEQTPTGPMYRIFEIGRQGHGASCHAADPKPIIHDGP